MNESKLISLSKISHELKNPLTLIQSTLQLIGCHYPEVTKDPMWSQLLLDTKYMSQLLSELSSLNSCQNMKYAKINIRQFWTEIVNSFSSLAHMQGKKLQLNFNIFSENFSGDPLKLREVFCNLIKNAFDATDIGDEIFVDVKSQWKCLIVIISDTGCGIDKERLENIFQPFVTYKPNGTGLGLPIVKNIINAHGGTVQVYSKPETGTKFMVVLPLEPSKKKE